MRSRLLKPVQFARVAKILPGFLACGFFFAVAPRALTGEDTKAVGDAIGAIEGESIAVDGPLSVEVVHGQVKTVLRSGSDVRVKVGQARIELIEGGTIDWRAVKLQVQVPR